MAALFASYYISLFGLQGLLQDHPGGQPQQRRRRCLVLLDPCGQELLQALAHFLTGCYSVGRQGFILSGLKGLWFVDHLRIAHAPPFLQHYTDITHSARLLSHNTHLIGTKHCLIQCWALTVNKRTDLTFGLVASAVQS